MVAITATGPVQQPLTGNQDIDGLLLGARWNGTNISFNFPANRSYYPSNYGSLYGEPNGFQAVSASFQSMVRDALAQYASVANLTFTEAGPTDPALISVARTSNLNGFNGLGYGPPGGPSVAGDVWFASSTQQVGDEEIRGRGTWRLVMHEIGHALGLKHGHEVNGPANTAMTPEHDFNDYSIMSYRRTQGGPITGTTQETYGNPQSLMMYDIAAIQTMYGANYSTQSGDSVYTWDPSTGQEFINGVAQTAPGANRIYATIWDGGGIDTYDLSNYATDLRIDLTPGGSSTFSRSQLAVVDTVAGTTAGGNIFNALLYNGDARSLIENARGGSGNDLIAGNEGNNTLVGGAGADTILGGNGNDVLEGDAGNDVIRGGDGTDTFILSGARSNYVIAMANGILTITDTTRADGTDTVEGVESFRFADSTLLLADLFPAPLPSTPGPVAPVPDPAAPSFGPDSLSGTDQADFIDLLLGDDTYAGGLGNDTVFGNEGEDVLFGNQDDDVLFGNQGQVCRAVTKPSTGASASC